MDWDQKFEEEWKRYVDARLGYNPRQSLTTQDVVRLFFRAGLILGMDVARDALRQAFEEVKERSRA